MRSNVILIGYMGSGKTTIGKQLADSLGYRLVDMDQEIEKIEGCTINSIFQEYGEEAFREKETLYLKENGNTFEETVLSTGGGTPIRQENVELLREIGTIVFLRTTPLTIYQRVKNNNTRPLLECENPQEKIEQMLVTRMPYYEAAAQITVDTDGRSVGDIVGEIIEELAQKNCL